MSALSLRTKNPLVKRLPLLHPDKEDSLLEKSDFMGTNLTIGAEIFV